MNDQHKQRFEKEIENWIRSVSAKLEIDAVGLWQIIPRGRKEFRLKDKDLIEFSRQSIFSLLAKGAMPVRGDKKMFFRVAGG